MRSATTQRRANRGIPGGFTLIELLLALAIFTIIGIATARQLQQLTTTKNIAFKEMDLYTSVRGALSILRFDISQAFHILYEDLGSETKQAILQNQSVPHTIFDGRKNQIIFTSLSHRVYYQERRECEQTSISYFLQQDKKSPYARLMKRESTMITDNLYEGGAIYGVLDNVKELSFQYWDPTSGKWQDDWSSDNAQFRDRFPLAVKVHLSVAKPDGSVLEIDTQIKIAFPNNDEFVAQL